MPTLQAPDGTRYETHDESEANALVVGHGYRVVANDTDQPEPVVTAEQLDQPMPEPSGAEPQPPALPDQPDDTEQDPDRSAY